MQFILPRYYKKNILTLYIPREKEWGSGETEEK